MTSTRVWSKRCGANAIHRSIQTRDHQTSDHHSLGTSASAQTHHEVCNLSNQRLIAPSHPANHTPVPSAQHLPAKQISTSKYDGTSTTTKAGTSPLARLKAAMQMAKRVRVWRKVSSKMASNTSVIRAARTALVCDTTTRRILHPTPPHRNR